jgi:hypothetical protein
VAGNGVPQPRPGRGGAAYPAPQRIQDQRPTVLGRDSDDDLQAFRQGNGYAAYFLEGDDPPRVHQAFAATLDRCYDRIRGIQREARERCAVSRPRGPAIVLRTPKGWTGPKEVDGRPTEGTFRSHQVPMPDTNPAHLAQLEEWMRSYEPQALFDADGKLIPELAALAPQGDRRMSANPHANGGALLVDLNIPVRTSVITRSTARGLRWCGRSPRVNSASCCATCMYATLGRRTSDRSAPAHAVIRPGSTRRREPRMPDPFGAPPPADVAAELATLTAVLDEVVATSLLAVGGASPMGDGRV